MVQYGFMSQFTQFTMISWLISANLKIIENIKLVKFGEKAENPHVCKAGMSITSPTCSNC